MSLRQVASDQRVGALYLVANGLADIVEKSPRAGRVDIGLNFGCEHGCNMRCLNGVGQNVLAIACPELESSEHGYQLLM